jgi:hypothetical protein
VKAPHDWPPPPAKTKEERLARLAMFREAINCVEARVNLDAVLTEIIDALLDGAEPPQVPVDLNAQLDS